MLAVNTFSASRRAPFDEQTSQAYTHGLEHIYALETVDPSTVKKIELPQPVAKESLSGKVDPHKDLWDGQHVLELGDEFLEWMPPLFLQEPVQMLGLSQRAEAVCLDKGIERLTGLVEADFNCWVTEKGVGQGHIDEIREKLAQYLEGRSLERSYHIDWKALIRSLTVGMERKKAYTLLQSFGLEAILPLTPMERMETLNLQESSKKKWIEEAEMDLKNPTRMALMEKALSRIVRVFFSSWSRARGGAIHLNEVVERTERISDDREVVAAAVGFLQQIYSFKDHPLAPYLVEVERGLYCADRSDAEAFYAICRKAQSYFYRLNVSYPFAELLSLMGREFGKRWQYYPEIFVQTCLKKSSCFRVRKGEGGKLMIQLRAS